MSYKHNPLDDFFEAIIAGTFPLDVACQVFGVQFLKYMQDETFFVLIDERFSREGPFEVLLPISAFREGREYQGEVIDGRIKWAYSKKDVHTEHCCKKCGCKYSNSDCTVVCGTLKQSYGHLHTSVCYERHPDYLRREREFFGQGEGDLPEEPDREDFPVYLASLLGVPEETSKEVLLAKVRERLGLL